MQQPPDLQTIAAQLRQPSGELGTRVGLAMNKSNEALINQAWQLLALPQGPAHLLEIGPGNGAHLANWLARNPSLTYTGVDYSAHMVQEACAAFGPEIAAGRAQFIEADVHTLPIANTMCEAVFTINTLYFWQHPSLALAQLHRVLRPGGVLLMALRTEATMQQLPFTAFGFTPYNRERLAALYASSPFGPSPIHDFHEHMRTDAAGNTYPADSFLVRAVKG